MEIPVAVEVSPVKLIFPPAVESGAFIEMAFRPTSLLLIPFALTDPPLVEIGALMVTAPSPSPSASAFRVT